MRISGNYADRLRYNIIPMAILWGIGGWIFSEDRSQGLMIYGGIAFCITWLIDTALIYQKFGLHLNKLELRDLILFNGIEIKPSQIIKITTENIYPGSMIAKWRITTIKLTLDNSSELCILAKPHSVFFYIKYFFCVLKDYFSDRRRYNKGSQIGFRPLSSYFVRETSQTADLLISKYPELQLKVY